MRCFSIMKKHSILSWLLAFCFCFAMSVPVMAAEANIEAQAMSRLAGFDFVQTANANEATVNIDGENIRIQNMSETATLDEISKAELADALEQISDVRAEEMDSETDVINYYYIADDKVYFYEEASKFTDGIDSKMVILDVDFTEAQSIINGVTAIEAEMDKNEEAEDNENGIMPLIADSLTIYNRTTSLDKGVAARLNVYDPDINRMQASVAVPTIAQMNGVNNSSIFNYIYLGFSGTQVESDIGLAAARKSENDTSLCGFKPYWLLHNDGSDVAYVPSTNAGVSSVQYYLPSTGSTTRTLTLELNKNDGNRIVGTVTGLAVYGSNSTQGTVKTIMTSKRFFSSQLEPISKWKAVNTLSPASGSIPSGTRSQCTFSNFSVDGGNLPLSICDAEIYNRGNTKYGSITATYKRINLLDSVTFILKP